MAKFLTSKMASAGIEDIATRADKELVLISPYIKIPDNLMERFKDLDRKNVKITLVCRKEDLKAEQRTRLSQIEHLELRFLDNLHAKCFYNQESMIIGSLNLYESPSVDNWEMGVLLTLKEDRDVFLDARKEADFIIRTAKVDESIKKQSHKTLESREKKQESPRGGFLEEIGKALGLSEQSGYCIRGGEKITYNPAHPLCDKHYDKWKEHKNPDYREHYCHRCGERTRTSYRRPLCPSCS